MLDDAEALHARAKESLLRGDTAGGITDLKAYLALEAEDAQAWLELGAAYAAVDHRVQAADALREAVDLDGGDVEARLAYARALVRLGKIDDAAFQLLQANKAAPDDGRVMKELGVAFYDKKLFVKAATWLRKATEQKLANAAEEARAFYALGLAEEARRDVGAALSAYREAVRRDGAFVEARLTLADALASMGEHEQAIAELDALLELQRTNERVAQNRDILARALEEMKRARLLGRTEKELASSALVEHGELAKKATAPREGGGTRARFAGRLIELDAGFDAEGRIDELFLALPASDRAAHAEDDRFKVTVLGADGVARPADLATAVSLTFLREALGCPMTQAGALYARLLAGEAAVTWGGAAVAFASGDGSAASRHGLSVRAS